MGLVAGILALLVHSNVTSNLQIPAIGLLVVVLGGALICHVRLQMQRVAETSTPPGGTLSGSGGHRRRRRP